MVASKFILTSSAILFSMASARPVLAGRALAKAPVSGKKFIRETYNPLVEVLSGVTSDVTTAQKAVTDLQMKFIATDGKPTSDSIEQLVSGIDSETDNFLNSLAPILDPQNSVYATVVSNMVVGSFFQQVLSSMDVALDSMTEVTVSPSLSKALEGMAVTLESMEAQATEQKMNENLITQISEVQKNVASHTGATSKARRQSSVEDSIVAGVTTATQNVDKLTQSITDSKGVPDLETLNKVITGLDSQIDSVIGPISVALAPVTMTETKSNEMFLPFFLSVIKSANTLLDIMTQGSVNPVLNPAFKNLESSIGNLANFAGKYDMGSSETQLININHRIHLLFVTNSGASAAPAAAAPAAAAPAVTAPARYAARLARNLRL